MHRRSSLENTLLLGVSGECCSQCFLTRNTNSTGGVEFTLVYNLRGDLTDEGGTGGYKYVWDAFGRLSKVKNQSNTLLAEYEYNGLNQRITWHYDADNDSDVDGSDPTYHFAYDEKWRMVGTWRGTDSEPKELFVNHQAGLAGHGSSSYIDTVALRDRDMTNGWTGSGDGTREQRHYYAQNWRADVSGIFDSAGELVEWDKYRAYGVPFLLTPGDHNKDGSVDKADSDSFAADYTASNIRADLDKSGTVTSADQTIFNASYANAEKGGRWYLSAGAIGSRKGYAGYEHDGDLPELAHVRNRVLHFGLGRWTRRDPMEYGDGAGLYGYGVSQPISATDPSGLVALIGKCSGGDEPEPEPNPPCDNGGDCTLTHYLCGIMIRMVRPDPNNLPGCTPVPDPRNPPPELEEDLRSMLEARCFEAFEEHDCYGGCTCYVEEQDRFVGPPNCDFGDPLWQSVTLRGGCIYEVSTRTGLCTWRESGKCKVNVAGITPTPTPIVASCKRK